MKQRIGKAPVPSVVKYHTNSRHIYCQLQSWLLDATLDRESIVIVFWWYALSKSTIDSSRRSIDSWVDFKLSTSKFVVVSGNDLPPERKQNPIASILNGFRISMQNEFICSCRRRLYSCSACTFCTTVIYFLLESPSNKKDSSKGPSQTESPGYSINHESCWKRDSHRVTARHQSTDLQHVVCDDFEA